MTDWTTALPGEASDEIEIWLLILPLTSSATLRYNFAIYSEKSSPDYQITFSDRVVWQTMGGGAEPHKSRAGSGNIPEGCESGGYLPQRKLRSYTFFFMWHEQCDIDDWDWQHEWRPADPFLSSPNISLPQRPCLVMAWNIPCSFISCFA